MESAERKAMYIGLSQACITGKIFRPRTKFWFWERKKERKKEKKRSNLKKF
jgi:hypothetical protein